VITKGWLPDFLPRSAHSIRYKTNYEQNKVIAAFSFNQSDDIAPIIQIGERLPASSLVLVRPPIICRKEPWFPGAITKGNLAELAPAGFTLYEIGRTEPRTVRSGRIVHWYLAVNDKAGICYLWN